ncbi:MAG: hypothetical protein IJ877_02865 [Candidatus Gastranaerophilales bacterium]|nr:hypothetical protein [Candidatus Gastranaerophilales bacterium]
MKNAVKTKNILDKSKYLITDKVYDNFVSIHKNLGFIEITPQHWQGETLEAALKYLGVNDEKGTKIKSPIEEIIIYKSHIEHLINDNDSYRKKHLNRAIRTIQEPNLIIKKDVYNNYVKLFIDNNDKIKAHLQIVKIKADGNFYVTNFKLTKQQFRKNILEGEIIYDLSSMSSTKVPT